MKFPICKVCLKNNILCNACAEKVGENEIKIDEIKMYRRLNKLLKDKKTLKDVEIKRIVGKDNLLIITEKGDISKLVGKDGSIVKKIARKLNMSIRIVEQSQDLRDFVAEILYTVSILGINIVYRPTGKLFKIRIPKSERTKLPISSEVFVSLSRSSFGVDADIVFE